MNKTLKNYKFNNLAGTKRKKGGMGKDNKKKNNKGENLNVTGKSIFFPKPPSQEEKPSSSSSNQNPKIRKFFPQYNNQSSSKVSKSDDSVKVITQEQPHENKTTRSISLFDSSENEQSNFIETLLVKNTNYFDDNNVYPFASKCPKKDGTPQKRLIYLAIACLNIIDGDGKPFKSYGYKQITNKREEYKGLIDFMIGNSKDGNDENIEVDNVGDASRGWWGKTNYKNYLRSLNELVNTIVNPIPNQKDNNWHQELYNKIICSLQLIVIVKSISDTSQFGQLVNYIPKLISRTDIHTEEANVSNIITRDAKIGFDSADKICIATSSLLVNSLPFPVETMCPRKSSMGGKNIQNIIIQKGIIASLANTINLLWNEANLSLDELSVQLSILYDVNDKQTGDFFCKILDIIINFKKTHSLSNMNKLDMNQLYDFGFSQKLKLEQGEVSETMYLNYETDFVFKNLSELTKSFKNLINDENNLNILIGARDKLFEDKKTIISSRWCYYLSKDVFKLKYPQSVSFGIDDNDEETELKTKTIKDLVSKHEILMATIDSTYGHDFQGIECIQKIGEKFMENDEYLKDFILPSNIKNRNENSAMIMCFKKSKCVNIDQISNSLSYNFNPEENFLTSETELSGSNYLNVFDSIFSINKPLVISVDLVKGFQIPLVSAASESIRTISNIKAQTPLINPINPNEMQEIVYNQIQKNGFGGEFRGSTNEFDGATNYGSIIPIIDAEDGEDGVLKPYETNYKYNNFNLKIETQSLVTKEEIETKFKEKLISALITPTENIYKILKDDYGLERENVIKILNEDYPQFIELYSQLLNNKVDNNGKIKITTDDYLYFFTGCKVFLKEQNLNNYPLYKRFCNYILKLPSKLNKDSATGTFYIIMANIIKFLIDNVNTSSDNKEKNKNFLINLFGFGVSNFLAKNIKPENMVAPKQTVFGVANSSSQEQNYLLNNKNFRELFNKNSKNYNSKLESPKTTGKVIDDDYIITRGQTEPGKKNVSGNSFHYIQTQRTSKYLLDDTGSSSSSNKSSPERGSALKSDNFYLNTLPQASQPDIETQKDSQGESAMDIEGKKGGKKTRRKRVKKNKLTKKN